MGCTRWNLETIRRSMGRSRSRGSQAGSAVIVSAGEEAAGSQQALSAPGREQHSPGIDRSGEGSFLRSLGGRLRMVGALASGGSAGSEVVALRLRSS